MTVHVRLFAMLRERAGRGELLWTVGPDDTVGDLWGALCAAFPRLGEIATTVTFAVNHEYVDRLHRLHNNDEIAIIPPVSGGAFHVPPHPTPYRPE